MGMLFFILTIIFFYTNAEAINYKTCYHCYGDNCENPQIILCPLEVNVTGYEQCFTKWNIHGELIELGCTSSYNHSEINYLINNKLIQLCDDNNCNNFNSNNTSNHINNKNNNNVQATLLKDNVKALLHCWHCKDDNCGQPKEEVCKNATANDQCFTLFDGKNNIIEMGCISEQDNNFINDNIKNLFMCNDQDNCNNFNNIPKPTICLQCNSRDTVECAINPSKLFTEVQCTKLPNTQCFVRVHAANGTTERGCTSDLNPNDLLACLNNNSTDCLICNEKQCNRKIFPENRRSCQRCNSKDDSNCDYSPNSPLICPIYSHDAFCTTKLVNGNTYRGCSTDFECDNSDKQYCRLCYNEDNCNMATLKGNNIGYPGIWSKVPLSCYVCRNEIECDNLSDQNLYVCNGDARQNCYTIFNANGAVKERGCTDDIYSNPTSDNYCNRNPQYCKFCKSDHCNVAKSLKDYKDCLFCDSNDNANCIFDVNDIKETRSCYNGCMTALYPRTEDENPSYDLTRSCLDDLGKDDRNKCANNNETLCQACMDDLCNTVNLVERLTCYTCEDDECELPKSLECKSYREHDKCFTLFNNEGHLTRMGCESDLNTDFLMQHKRQLILCDGDNCNDLKNLPMKYTCQTCNSKSDAQCASGNVADFKACHMLPYTSCYTRLDKNGITHRGCLSDLNDDTFNECITSDNTNRTCELCEGNNCNNKVYPENRRSCYRCDSTTYTACEDYPMSFASICPIYKEDDVCVTTLKNDHTYRGCKSELNCDPSKPELCRYCNRTDNCNSVNLRAAYVGSPGKWQNLPLNCLTCEGDGCINSNNLTTMECKGNLLQTCTTVFGMNDAVMMRGCSDFVAETYEDYCDMNTYHCIACKSNHCNNAANRTVFVDCYYCDSSEDPSCARNFNFNGQGVRTRKCHQSCMVALYPYDNSTDPSYELTRTCLDDLEVDDRDKCGTTANPYCVKCDNSKCNVMDLPEKRHECFFCNSDKCETIVNKTCQLYHPNDQCYILIDSMNNIADLGCRSALSDNITDLLLQKKLLLCDGVNCNSPDIIASPQRCIECDSERNPWCATNPNLIMDTKFCTNLPYTNCYTRIDEDGYTVRGCLSSLDGNNFFDCMMGNDKLCTICLGDQCNQIDIFPSERLKCHQCDSLTDPQCAVRPSSLKVCPLYEENDKCVTHLSGQVTIRGCASSDVQCDDEDNQLNCQICETNGCNNANLVSYENLPGKWQELPLTCYTCQNKEECKDLGVYRPCLSNPLDRCMTVFDEDGTVIRRGCSSLVQSDYGVYCIKYPNKCMNCNSNGCNLAKSLNDYVECLSCDSALHATCVSNVTEIAQTRNCYKYCMTALYSIDGDDDNPSYTLTRTCYDDMDHDDRETCANNTNNLCKVCNQPRCNTDLIPAKRHQCYMCKGNKCQDPKISECYNYRPDDACYIRYDETHSIVSMGCRSEFTNVEFKELLKQKRLFVCDEENCNTFDNLPSKRQCVLCNSRTDEDCASNPSAVKSRTSCRIMPFTDCYTRILPDGATERGCLSNLYDNEFLTCLNGTSTTCETCQDDNCNNEIYPVGRLKCQICDSKFSSTCEMKPESISICPLYQEGDVCVTTLKNNITNRHCHSSLSCDNEDPQYCNKCTEDGCNIINLAKISRDNNYGKWQKLPLTCFSCSHEECKTLNNTHTETCGPNVLQDCVTVFDSDDVVRRGCSDAIDYEYYPYCDLRTENCYKCKSNKCNTATSKTEFFECVYCDSKNDIECVSNPNSDTHAKRLCQRGCMTALYPNDVESMNQTYNLIRTCLTDKELKDQDSCVKGSDKNCKACSSDNCNTDNLPETRLSCYTCVDDYCEKPKSQLCPTYVNDDKCFARFDEENSLIEMGCVSSLENVSVTDLIKTKRVAICSGNNCNDMRDVPNLQICLQCNSIDDHDCATQPKEIGTVEVCNMMPYTACYNKLNPDGTTQRGCLSDLPEDDFVKCALNDDKNCSICIGADGKEICNRDIFPKDRQQCYTCNSDDDRNCVSFPKDTKPCPIVSLEESCVTALSGNTTVRGCRSSVYCDENDVNTCRSCFGTECNAIDLLNKMDDNYHGIWQELPLKCYTCSGYDCHSSLGVSTLCSEKNIKQDCKTVFTSDGKVKRRGCSDDVDDYEDRYCREHPELCFICKSNECNIAWDLNDYIDCIFCDSTNDTQCIQNPNITTIWKRQCYQKCMVTKHHDAITRSCLDDREWSQHKACIDYNDDSSRDDSAECFVCSHNNCNNFPLPKNRLKCHMCNDTLCINSVGKYCENDVENDYCYAKYNNIGNVEVMGCLSSLSNNDINDWAEQNVLYKCPHSECNELTKLPKLLTCLKCDSSTAPNCAQHPEEINETEVCPLNINQCVTRILPNGHTSRGCSAYLNATDDVCIGEESCEICSGNNCNGQIFPRDRRQCYICDAANTNDCINNPKNIQVCVIYKSNSSCVIKHQNGAVLRGCTTDIACGDTESYCDICEGNACNGIPSTSSVPAKQIISIAFALMLIYMYKYIILN